MTEISTNSESKVLKSGRRDRWIGILLIAVSAASFGAMAIFARLAYAAGANPITVLFLRFTLAAVFMAAVMAARGMAFPRGRTLITLAFMGGIGYVGIALAYFTALTMASAGLVAILLYLYPAFVTLLAAVFLKKPLTILKLAALVLALGGTVCVIGLDRASGQALGMVLGVTAAVLYSIYIIIGSTVMPHTDAFSASTTVIIAAGFVSSAIAAITGVNFPATLTGWLAALAIALISTALGIVAFFAGLKRIDPASASMISTLEPLVTVALAATVLGETMTMPKILGGMMILSAVVLLARNEANETLA